MTNDDFAIIIKSLRQARRMAKGRWQPMDNPMPLPDGSEIRFDQRADLWGATRYERGKPTSNRIAI